MSLSVLADVAGGDTVSAQGLTDPVDHPDMSGWVQTWSAEAARRGDFRSVSDWLGVDVDGCSAPLLPLAGIDQRIATQERLIEARSRHALALLARMGPRRPESGGGAGEREARPRQYGQQHRAALRSRS